METKLKNGLVEKHAFAITKFVTVNYKNKEVKLVRYIFNWILFNLEF
jgi:hypothetical protein